MSHISNVVELIRCARDRVIILTAYVGETTLDSLLDAVSEEVKETAVFVRWKKRDIVTGASDWRAWDVAARHRVPFYACHSLHAKVYIADNSALVGSANATASGLGVGKRPNIELLVPMDADDEHITKVLNAVETQSTLAAPMGSDLSTGSGLIPSPDTDEVSYWLPQSSPESIVAAMNDPSCHTAETRAVYDAFGLAEGKNSLGAIRQSVRKTTVFRVVREAFDGRPLPMSLEELRDLLAQQLDTRLRELSDERMALLISWLGRFGENTHLPPSFDDDALTLSPGTLITTFPTATGV